MLTGFGNYLRFWEILGRGVDLVSALIFSFYLKKAIYLGCLFLLKYRVSDILGVFIMTTVNAINAAATDAAGSNTESVKKQKDAASPVFQKAEKASETEKSAYPDLKLSTLAKNAKEDDKSQESNFSKFMKGAFTGLFKGLFTKGADIAAIGFVTSVALGYAAFGGIVFGTIIGGIAMTYAIKEGLDRLNNNMGTSESAIA